MELDREWRGSDGMDNPMLDLRSMDATIIHVQKKERMLPVGGEKTMLRIVPTRQSVSSVNF